MTEIRPLARAREVYGVHADLADLRGWEATIREGRAPLIRTSTADTAFFWIEHGGVRMPVLYDRPTGRIVALMKFAPQPYLQKRKPVRSRSEKRKFSVKHSRRKA